MGKFNISTAEGGQLTEVAEASSCRFTYPTGGD